MSSIDLLLSSGVNIWCSERIPYGSQITLISSPIRINGKWVSKTLENTYTQIHTDMELLVGERLIILKTNGSYESLHGYIAVTPEVLDQVTDALTENISKQLESCFH